MSGTLIVDLMLDIEDSKQVTRLALTVLSRQVTESYEVCSKYGRNNLCYNSGPYDTAGEMIRAALVYFYACTTFNRFRFG